MSKSIQDPAEFLFEMFEYEFCSECGRDRRHHVAILDLFGNWIARCEFAPQFDTLGNPVINPEESGE